MWGNVRRKLTVCLLLVALAVLMVPTYAFADVPGDPSQTIVWNLQNDSANRFTTLLGAATSVGLDEVLNDNSEQLTLFAPTDDAFAALEAEIGSEALQEILDDPEALTLILLYHVVPGSVESNELTDGEVETILGLPISVETSPSIVLNARASVIETDNAASNGVVHVIDQVLVPDLDDLDDGGDGGADDGDTDAPTTAGTPSLPKTGIGPDAVTPVWPLLGLVSAGAAGIAYRARRRNARSKR